MKTMQVRSEMYALRLTPAEAATLVALANQRCTSGAAVVRQGIRQMAEEAGIQVPAVEKLSDGQFSEDRTAAQ